MKSKIDYNELRKLIDLMDEKDLNQFELEVEGFKIMISRGQSQPAVKNISAVPMSTLPTAERPEETPGEIPLEKPSDSIYYIRSPMVGTFYRAPNPSSPPFIEAGEPVKKNQIVSIIEAMKLMNEIESDVDGVVEEILVENGKPVEYGQKLIAVKLN
ncbi:MAG: acetyl-CoA carboxylase biotin carboxyl carrier protein [Candidatus Aminicenantes bacterium]|nr:acetyl-CoA carboxylase biotin carboxyl carrier protein [Candidatus Aminicenantes bacterium]